MRAFLPYAALVTAMLIWSSSFIALKIAFVDYSPLLAIWGRMAVATAMFVLMFRMLPKVRYEKGDIWLLLGMALMEPCLYFVFEGYALTYTSAGQAGMISATLPLLVGVAAFLFLREKIGVARWVGFCLALIGVVAISLSGEEDIVNAANPVLGNFLEVLAMCCATGYTILVKKLTSRYSPFFLIAVQSAAGMFFFSPALLFSSGNLANMVFSTSTLAIVYLGIVVTLGGYGLYTYGVSRLPASQASVYVNLIPVFTVFMSWFWLGEQFTLAQAGGAALVFLGIYLSRISSQHG